MSEFQQFMKERRTQGIDTSNDPMVSERKRLLSQAEDDYKKSIIRILGKDEGRRLLGR